MVKFRLNVLVRAAQYRTLIAVVLVLVLTVTALCTLASSDKPRKKPPVRESNALSSIVDESFSDANTESALSAQQGELESLKTQMAQLKESLQKASQAQEATVSQLSALAEVNREHASVQLAQNNTSLPSTSKTAWDVSPKMPGGSLLKNGSVRVHSVAFYYRKHQHLAPHQRLTPAHYVPSGTFVRAVVLGGADADASVSGQSKNNGVMLFKLLQPGTLPNGQRSHLQGCFVTAASYGDISSERAYVVLDKLSCAQPGQAIIDKTITGWAFFGGKVGIKGIPLMRDNKVMQWAGISGALAGIASAAQYSQSVQSISPLGSATAVPSSNIAPYAAYGGASKAAEVLSNYYVKRAEQYHPVIQVGSGNLVTIVFKDGFYLEPDEAVLAKGGRQAMHQEGASLDSNEPNFEVPSEVLSKIDKHFDDTSEVNK